MIAPRYDYTRPMHSIGEYLMLGMGIVWAWINVVLSFITYPQLSSRFICWLRALFAFLTTTGIIIYIFIHVRFATSFLETNITNIYSLQTAGFL